MGSLATLPALAKAVNGWFPELGGRMFPVADSEITPENIPTLPMGMCVLVRGQPSPTATNPRMPSMLETIGVEFWFPPIKNKREDGSESPFYAFYDYDAIARRLLPRIAKWESPKGSIMRFNNLDVEATPFAVIIQFVFTHDAYVCDEDEELGEYPPIDCNIVPQICVTLID